MSTFSGLLAGRWWGNGESSLWKLRSKEACPNHNAPHSKCQHRRQLWRSLSATATCLIITTGKQLWASRWWFLWLLTDCLGSLPASGVSVSQCFGHWCWTNNLPRVHSAVDGRGRNDFCESTETCIYGVFSATVCYTFTLSASCHQHCVDDSTSTTQCPQPSVPSLA